MRCIPSEYKKIAFNVHDAINLLHVKFGSVTVTCVWGTDTPSVGLLIYLHTAMCGKFLDLDTEVSLEILQYACICLRPKYLK